MGMTGGTAKLVHTGYLEYGTGPAMNLYVYYKSTQDVANNKSTVYCGMYFTITNSYWNIGAWADSGSYLGDSTSDTFKKDVPAGTTGTMWIRENASFTVNHNSDGTAKATIYWKWGVNSPWGQFVKPSGSFTITLPTIPRASVPTVATSSPEMCKTLTINTNRKSSSFTHTLKYTFGGKTETIAEGVGASYPWEVPDLASLCDNATSGECTITCITYNGTTNIGTKTCKVTLKVPSATVPTLPTSTASSPKYAGDAITISLPRKSSNFTHYLTYEFAGASGEIGSYSTSAPWTIPYSLCSKIPSAWSGTITIACTTYNGTAKVDTSSVYLYFKVPDNSTTKPKISGISLAPVSSLASPFDKLYIQGMSKVKATYTTSAPYSSVESVKMAVQSKTVAGTTTTATSGYLSNGSNVAVSFTVTNARGQTNTGSATISTVYEYSKPLVVATSNNAKAICSRGNEDGTVDVAGLKLVIKAKRQYSSIGGNNTCTLWYRIKTYDGLPLSDSAEKKTLLSSSNSANEYSSAVSGVTLSNTLSYTVEVGVTDQLSDDASIVYFIPTSEATFHLAKGGKGASFGGYSKGDGLEVPWKSTFTGAVHGKAYGLGSLPSIPKNSDINNYTTPGVYSIISNDYAETMTYLPNAKAGRLVVSSSDGSGRSNGTWAYLLQEYITYDGYYRYYRLIRTEATADKWTYNTWWCDSSTYWQDLGLSSNVSASSQSIGRTPYGCAYRVENENHVYISFNCGYNYTGNSIIVNENLLPVKYRPARPVYSLCPAGGKYIARVLVTVGGNVYIEWVQSLLSTSDTTSLQGTLIDGYIDYWV